MKLIYKVTTLVAAAVIVSVIVFGVVFNMVSKEKILSANIEEATSLANLVSQELTDPVYFLDIEQINETIMNIKQNPGVKSVYVMHPDGTVISDGTVENPLYNQKLNDELTTKSMNSNQLLLTRQNALYNHFLVM